MNATLRSLTAKPWRLWMTQFRTIVGMELRKNFFTWRAFWIYPLAFGPTAITALGAIIGGHEGVQHDTGMLGAMFQFYYLRLAIFFGCLGIFTRLIRGEMIERSLHFYLLAPVRREILVLGKYVAGTITVVSIFALAFGAAFAFVYAGDGPAGMQYVFDGPGMSQLASYLGITLLACLGYGSLFLTLSMIFRNPIVPGIVLLGWETINPVLPAFMQKLSVTFYLRHLSPVSVPAEGVFALLTVVTEPVPAWAATLGLICLVTLALVIACRRSRTLEISYTTD